MILGDPDTFCFLLLSENTNIMSYSIEIANCLCSVFDKVSTLEAADLAGYRENITFWDNEYMHCMEVLKGYSSRFQIMKEGINKFQQTRGLISDSIEHGRGLWSEASLNPKKPLKKAIKNSQIKDSITALSNAYERFLNRLEKEQLLSTNERNGLRSCTQE